MAPNQDQGYRRDHPLTYDASETAIPENEIVGSVQSFSNTVGPFMCST